MGAEQSARRAGSAEPSGFVTVSSAQAPRGIDPDAAALHRLPPCAPLIRPSGPTSVRSFFSSSKTDNGLPKLPPRGVTDLCSEYARFSREVALPLVDAQKVLGVKMANVEATCTRILYVMALRAGELSSCATSLREIPSITAQLAEVNALLEQCTAKADGLTLLLPEEVQLELKGDAGSKAGQPGEAT